MQIHRSIKISQVVALSVLIALLLCGCAAFQLQSPLDESLQTLSAKYVPEAARPGETSQKFGHELSFIPWSIKEAYQKAVDGGEVESAKRIRNEVIADFLNIGQQYHTALDDSLYSRVAGTDTFLDITGISASALSTVLTGGSTPNALSGLATIAQGSRESITKNLFFGRAADAVVTQMKAIRAKQELVIREGMLKSPDRYSLQVACADCVKFIFDGSVTDAFAELVAQAETKRKRVDEAIDKVQRTGTPLLFFSHERMDSTTGMLGSGVGKTRVPSNDSAFWNELGEILAEHRIETGPRIWWVNALPEERAAVEPLLPLVKVRKAKPESPDASD